jgi:2-dehydro-3-deoxygluconokinase
MVELRHTTPDTLTIDFAGDTYNAAVYLARAAKQLNLPIEVGYLSGLGTDDYSDRMRAAWQLAAITDRSVTIADAAPGLYVVRTDRSGERHFDYWRDGSAAARLFARPDWALGLEADIVYLSGITLQLTPQPTRTLLNQRLAELRRQGSLIAFDTNYRAAGWREIADAQCAISTFAGISHFVFATYDDEQQLFADPDPEFTGQRYLAAGAGEVIVKLGADGALVFSDNHMFHVRADKVQHVVDTTAAGDSFAGTYLASRVAGTTAWEAGRRAASVAAQVVRQVGAIVATEMPLPSPIQVRSHSR